ncbi:hypothetical protein E4T63_25795 [Pseudomonas fluorescens]|uniref:Uncharacterized protein n=1 Tax=Pseudomonas fluorescens TaxID=294 RepID=A0AAP9CKR7_PSEFL|nr:hypothetical protein E4T63_25795 [Pseudomonas fluorescens]
MSGLREEQRWKEELVTRIVGFLPVETRWCLREQARSHRSTHSNVGAGLLAKRAEQAPQP